MNKLTAQQISTMVKRVDSTLLPQCEYEDFEPNASIVRLGDYGYVTEQEWSDAFANEPYWAEIAYETEGNLRQDNAHDIIADTYNDGGAKALLTLLDETGLPEVYFTNADDNGEL